MVTKVSEWRIARCTLWTGQPHLPTSKDGYEKFSPILSGQERLEIENQGGNWLTKVYLENGH